MASFNKVILAGNLTRDPEFRHLPKGSAVAAFALAVNRTWKSESGESKEEVNFIDVEAFGRQAEVIAQYMRKGRHLLVEGRLKQDSWEDKTTQQKRTKLKVVLESFSFIDAKGEGGAAAGNEAPRRPASSSSAPVSKPSESEGEPPMEDDDVPF